MTRPTRAEIDLGALRHNFQIVKQHAPTQQVMAVVKANAYGHGVLPVAQALADADALAVAFIDEALELRSAGIDTPLVLLEGVFNAAELREAAAQDIQIVVHQEAQAQLLCATPLPRPVVAWLKLDTGMHRLGLSVAQFASIYPRLQNHANVSGIRLMSHFACSDDPASAMSDTQEAYFDEAVADMAGADVPVSLCNSAALLSRPSSLRDWVRPGIMLYGASPFIASGNVPGKVPENVFGQDLQLRPVMTLTSTLISVRDIAAREAVGYSALWQAQRDSRIGVVAIGYGDGYPRAMPHGAPLWCRGQRVPLVGRVSMDMITVDLTDCPAAAVGDEVELWGEQVLATELAGLHGSIAYEMFCRITARVPRVYIST